MPELPEVEITQRGIAPYLINETILGARTGKPLRMPLGCEPSNLQGLTIKQIERRGKYVILTLSEDNSSKGVLLLHLGMSGSLKILAQPASPAGRHDHFDLLLTSSVLRLTDPRRFGMVVYADNRTHPKITKLLGHLGVEPFSNEFTLNELKKQLENKRSTIKSVLLAGKVVVGVGNIYASEALFLSGINPCTRACDIPLEKVKKLKFAIRKVLRNAIEQGGSSLKDFRHVDGSSGYFQLNTKVYGRSGEPCFKCRKPILQLKQNNRSTFWCAHCQC